MNTPVISAAAAQELNRKVQEKIDPRLFLCCNYTPGASYAAGEDGAFLTAIQDLYKFAIDSGCIIKSYKKFLPPWSSIPPEMKDRFKQLAAALSRIQMLRSVISHNTSEQNGYLERERLSRYGEWLRQVLGKPAPENPADFARLHQELAGMAAGMLAGLDCFIDCVAALTDREKTVNSWIGQTLYWYCNNTKQDFYKGQIMDAYLARARENGKEYPELYRIGTLFSKIQVWSAEALRASLDRELAAAEHAVATSQSILSVSDSLSKTMRERMTDGEWESMQAYCREQIARNEEKKAVLNRDREVLERKLESTQPLKCLFEGLEDRLRATMADCDAQGVPYTLLPQDLLQTDVERFFGKVPSCCGDF